MYEMGWDGMGWDGMACMHACMRWDGLYACMHEMGFGLHEMGWVGLYVCMHEMGFGLYICMHAYT